MAQVGLALGAKRCPALVLEVAEGTDNQGAAAERIFRLGGEPLRHTTGACFDLDQRLADRQPDGQCEEGRLTRTDGGVVAHTADRVALAEVLDAEATIGLLVDADMIARDVVIFNDVAPDAVAL